MRLSKEILNNLKKLTMVTMLCSGFVVACGEKNSGGTVQDSAESSVNSTDSTQFVGEPTYTQPNQLDACRAQEYALLERSFSELNPSKKEALDAAYSRKVNECLQIELRIIERQKFEPRGS